MNLENKVAIITGGARGIGKAVAISFIQEGAKVIIVARTKKEVRATEKKLRKLSSKAVGIVADISKKRGVEKVVKKTLENFQTIDILVNCAGVQKPIGKFWQIDIVKWQENININLIGTALCCQLVLPIMIKNKKGKIINFSGGGATSPRPNFSAYACAKTAIVRLTEIIALEVKKYNIDVNAIAPGAVNTRMLEEVIEAGKKAGEELAEALKRNKAGGTPPELAAELAVFLASEESNGLTGKLISAVWDRWKDFKKIKKQLNSSSLYTLRRVDGGEILIKE